MSKKSSFSPGDIVQMIPSMLGYYAIWGCSDESDESDSILRGGYAIVIGTFLEDDDMVCELVTPAGQKACILQRHLKHI